MIKVIKVNRKRVGVTLILIGLMFIMVVFEKNIDSKLKFTALINNNVKALKEYRMLGDTYTYKLPENWKTRNREFEGNEIVYHNEFTSDDDTIRGIVQGWNIKGDLADFLKKSSEISLQQNIIKNYKMNKVDIDDKKSYEVTYSLVDGKNNVYKVFEYFIPREGGFIRFSFFVNEANYKDSIPAVFKTIVRTLQKL